MINTKNIKIKNIYYMLSYAFQYLKQSNYENIAEEDTDELKTPWSIIRNVTLINNNEMERT